MFGDPVFRSLIALAKIRVQRDKQEVLALPPSIASYLPQKTQKITHRPPSFSHESVQCDMSPKFRHLPDCDLKSRDAVRNGEDMKRGFVLIPALHEECRVKGKVDPWSLLPAGAPGNLASGYGNNRKMFNNVRLNGD